MLDPPSKVLDLQGEETSVGHSLALTSKDQFRCRQQDVLYLVTTREQAQIDISKQEAAGEINLLWQQLSIHCLPEADFWPYSRKSATHGPLLVTR